MRVIAKGMIKVIFLTIIRPFFDSYTAVNDSRPSQTYKLSRLIKWDDGTKR